jgi:hypothetical protein
MGSASAAASVFHQEDFGQSLATNTLSFAGGEVIGYAAS